MSESVNWAWRYIRWEDRNPDVDERCDPEDTDQWGAAFTDESMAAVVEMQKLTHEQLERDVEITVGGMKLTAYAFQVWDDDRHGVVLGWFVGDHDSDEAFEPLAYAQRDYGHTEIHYLRDGKWVQL